MFRTSCSLRLVMAMFVTLALIVPTAAQRTGWPPQIDAEQHVYKHARVARHYDISSINLPAELADRIEDGTMTWESFGGTHPGPAGNQLAADLVAQVLTVSDVKNT